MRVIAAHYGSRQRYAIPLLLQQAGLLERFYTDLFLRRQPSRGWSALLTLAGSARLLSRVVPFGVAEKAFDFPHIVAAYKARKALVKGNAEMEYREHLRFDRAIGRAMVAAGYGRATHVLSALGESMPFLVEGRRRGLRVLTDIYVMLSADRIVAAEQKEFPGWESPPPDYAEIFRGFYGDGALLENTDLALCPSGVVRDDLVKRYGFAPDRAVVIPYGVDSTWFSISPAPVRGRVLFAGTASLRKGIQYLAIASNQLAQRGYPLDIRVAGDVAQQIASQYACRHLTFLGRVSASRLRQEFSEAEVLVLPSLAEGSAGVTYQALAACVPVITTVASGSVVRDGVEGLIVPERDPTALADAIAKMYEQRETRARMADAGRSRAREYGWSRYASALVDALRDDGQVMPRTPLSGRGLG